MKRKIPEYSNVKSNAINLQSLLVNKSTKFKILIKKKFAPTIYNKKTDALKALKNHIIICINKTYLMQLTNKKTIFQKLKS